jgi:eukaryotic-like serine/threonine-protein kinase
VKVLDFGLAKLIDSDGSAPGLMQSPTLTAAGTINGIILGTAAYLSPEQARGRTLDKHCDIWAFGCVLYEMLTGRAVFTRETVSDTISAILTQEPDWSALPDDIVPAVRRLLHRCLAKDARHRLHDIGDARLDLDEILASPSTIGRSTAPRHADQSLPRHGRWMARLPWMLLAMTALALVAVSAAATRFYTRPVAPAAPVRFTLAPPGAVSFSPTANFYAISPDGRYLAFVATSAQVATVWVRPLDSLDARPLKGTEGARQVFWSPDSRFIGFFSAGGFIKKIPVSGGPPQTLAAGTASGTGATWNSDGVILFSSLASPIQRLAATGNEPPIAVTAFTEGPQQQPAHFFPLFLPDGKRFLYVIRSPRPEQNGIYLRDLESRQERLLLNVASSIAFVPPNYLLYVRDRGLIGQAFDPTTATISGEPFVVADAVDYFPESGMASFSASHTGTLVYRSSAELEKSRLLWFDRKGNQTGEVMEPAPYRNPRLSPDGKRLVVEQVDVSGNRDIYIIDLEKRLSLRFTFDPGGDAAPVWSNDGLRIAWQRGNGTYLKLSNGTGQEERIQDEPFIPDDWEPAGRGLLMHPNAPRLVLRLPIGEADRTPRTVIEGRGGITTHARVSPDGRWVAYANADDGPFQVWLQNYPTASGRWQVSTTGGIQPKWGRDNKELFYLSTDGRLMAVPVTLGALPEIGKAQPLFETKIESVTGFTWHQYDVSQDGQRFLVNTPETVKPPVTVVLGWPALVGR